MMLSSRRLFPWSGAWRMLQRHQTFLNVDAKRIESEWASAIPDPLKFFTRRSQSAPLFGELVILRR